MTLSKRSEDILLRTLEAAEGFPGGAVPAGIRGETIDGSECLMGRWSSKDGDEQADTGDRLGEAVGDAVEREAVLERSAGRPVSGDDEWLKIDEDENEGAVGTRSQSRS